MKILFKNILRNILSNKRRSIALILCMTVVAFSAMAAFSVSGSAKSTLDGIMSQHFGDAKIVATNTFKARKDVVLPEGTDPFYVANASIDIQKRSKENFIYPSKFSYTVVGIDVSAGKRRGFILLDEDIPLGEGDVIITAALARAESLSIGSTIDVLDAGKEPMTLTVKGIAPNELFLKSRGACLVSNIDTAQRLSGRKGIWDFCYIAVADNGDVDAAYEAICQSNPDFSVNNVSSDGGYFEMLILFLGIFIVLALIISVVTAGISEHIVRERMSGLGTLRSLGATKAYAGAALIMENLFYGITGAFIGSLLYIPAHAPFIESFISGNSTFGIDYSIPWYNFVIVYVVTALLSCGSSLKAILKAVKTPIRDIIFGNRDTAYKLVKPRAYFGIGLMAVGVLCGLLISDAVVALLSLVMFVVGLIFFVPLILDIIKNLTRKCKDPIIRFSFTNIATKKTVVDSTILYAVVIGLVTAVLMLVSDAYSTFDEKTLGGDIVVEFCDMSEENYRFISTLDEVSDVELVYDRLEFVEINGEASGREVDVIGYGDKFRYYNGVKGLPDSIAEDEVSLDESTMVKLGINEGDKVALTLNAKGERPIRLTLTAIKGCNTMTVTYGMRNGIVINQDLYIKHFLNFPSSVLITLKDPENAEAVTEKISTLLMDKNAEVRTFEEYAEIEGNGDSIYFMLASIIGIGCLLSIILLITNQSVGFEQRKKELAVLHSTSMSKAQLKKLLFSETAFSILIASVMAVISGIVEFMLMISFVSALATAFGELSVTPTGTLIMLVGMYLLALLTTTANGKRLKKMNTAEQMKYE